MPGGKVVASSTDNSSATDPINLTTEFVKFSDITTFVPFTSYPEIALSDIIIKSNYWLDIDGDANPNVTGGLKIKWQDSEGNDITETVKNNANSELKGCSAPYQLTIEAANGVLSTQYGDPRTSNFTGGKHTYYINPKIVQPEVCNIRPNLSLEFPDASVSNGPDWKAHKGFYVMDLNKPEVNFPTTGSNNLFFDIVFVGEVPATSLVQYNGSNVYPISGSGVHLELSAPSKGVLRLYVKGPTASNSSGFSPSIFRLYKDQAKNDLLYAFNIQRWYVAKLNGNGNYDSAVDFCNSLSGYRVPLVTDFTNSNRMNWHGGIPGVNGDYQRRISYKQNDGSWMGGLFNEWGAVANESTNYPGTDWGVFDAGHQGWSYGSYFWTSNKENDTYNFVVESHLGATGDQLLTDNTYGVACVTP
ncbi:hypothetical protein [Gilliamella sp. wkB108]|uniref:hypothetical protein n=1 Tax=Gilliamella sp. wkB108 TaxID=3120256 RepID=UPI0011472014|nr:hypothetical protein [Gilliamella apicola]